MSSALRHWWRLPALQALLLQGAAFGPMLLTVYLLARLHFSPTYFHAALIQGVLAGALCWWRRLAPWWRLIALAFPLALQQALALELPATPFLLGFLLLLAMYWSTFRTQVPYYPSSRQVWLAALARLPQGRALRVIDIGCGLGGLVLELARARPECEVLGIELAPLPWAVARLRALVSGSRARFLRGDYAQLDFADFDAVFAYLSPAAMPALWTKARAEMRPGSVLMSLEFAIPGHAPDATIRASARDPALYLWNF